MQLKIDLFFFGWVFEGLAGGYGGLGGVSAGRDGASGGLAGVFGRRARVGFGPRLGPLDAIPEGSEGLTGIYEGRVGASGGRVGASGGRVRASGGRAGPLEVYLCVFCYLGTCYREANKVCS